MSFMTELFSRPRPHELGRVRIYLTSVGFCDPHRPAPLPRPADFPRLTRRLRAA
jgi:hypothetical protein